MGPDHASWLWLCTGQRQGVIARDGEAENGDDDAQRDPSMQLNDKEANVIQAYIVYTNTWAITSPILHCELQSKFYSLACSVAGWLVVVRYFRLYLAYLALGKKIYNNMRSPTYRRFGWASFREDWIKEEKKRSDEEQTYARSARQTYQQKKLHIFIAVSSLYFSSRLNIYYTHNFFEPNTE